MSNRGREPVLSRLVVPQDAIQHIDDKPVAFVEEQPGTYEKRTVTLGSEDEPYVEILDGLKDGERVVTLRIVLSQVYHAGRIAWRAFAPPSLLFGLGTGQLLTPSGEGARALLHSHFWKILKVLG